MLVLIDEHSNRLLTSHKQFVIPPDVIIWRDCVFLYTITGEDNNHKTTYYKRVKHVLKLEEE